jgi:hypothetical protein
MFNFLTDATAIDPVSGLDRNVSAPNWYVYTGSDFYIIIRQ